MLSNYEDNSLLTTQDSSSVYICHPIKSISCKSLSPNHTAKIHPHKPWLTTMRRAAFKFSQIVVLYLVMVELQECYTIVGIEKKYLGHYNKGQNRCNTGSTTTMQI